MAAVSAVERTILLPQFDSGKGADVIHAFVNSLTQTYAGAIHAATATDGASSLRGVQYQRLVLILTSAQDATLVASLPALATALGLAQITTFSVTVQSQY